MNVLHLWKSDSPRFGSGGAMAMYLLHSGLREAGVDSKILCEKKATDCPSVYVLQKSKLEVLEKLLKKITSRIGLNDIHRLSSFQLKQHEVFVEADILHFHGTHHRFINYLALPTLTRNKSSVFTLHGMWVLTGHCGYSFDCERWKTGCGKCPYPDSNPPIKRDGTALEWKLKDWIYRQLNLTLICPSNWIAELAKQSPLTNRFPIHYIPNGIDTEVFQPLDPEQCRSELGLPSGKKVLMFASVWLHDYRKGGDLLMKALQSLPESLKAETILLLMGDKDFAIDVDMQTFNLGYLSDERSKAVAYSAADLFLFPTRADNLPIVLQESIACGTPMVSFKVGGVPDLVRHRITGYLAQAENTKDFRDGIIQLLEDESLRHQMSQQCRAIAMEEFGLELYSLRHIVLYDQLWKN